MYENSPRFAVSRTIGRGQSSPADVQNLRRALVLTGHGSFPDPGAPNVTPGLIDAIERFQSEFGLTRDAVIRPGGPTERALSMALYTRNRHGRDGMEDLRQVFARNAKAGLIFQSDPATREAGIWTDESGTARSIINAETYSYQRPRHLAMMRRPDQVRQPGKNLLEGGGGYMPRGNIGAGATLRAVINQLLKNSLQPEASGSSPPDIKAPTHRMAPPPDNLETRIPPLPPKPPEDRDEPEEFPAAERGPSVLVSPVLEEGKPQIEVFPDQSNLFERWLIFENGRGAEDGQQKDLQYVIDQFYRKMEARDLLEYYEHAHGAHTAKGEYRKERVVWPNPKQQTGSRRPDFSIKVGKDFEDVNIVDTLADNTTPNSRERKALAGIIANKKDWKERGSTRTIGKSKGMSWEEFKILTDPLIDIMADEIEKKIRRNIAKGQSKK